MARSADKLAAVAADVVGAGGEAPVVIVGDVRLEQDCDRAVAETVAKLGSIDAVINNAGLGLPGDLSKASTADYLQMMETNVHGVVYLTRAALVQMRQAKRGHVIMISSRAGIEANPTAPLYCTSKFALEGYTEGLRKQADTWRASEGVNIRVTNLKPGNVDSGYWGTRAVPREKFMTTDEIAEAIWWVLSAPETMNVVELQVESRR
jgi:NADP-dependent 3-hydroxy acid dehydrogenase YdfG